MHIGELIRQERLRRRLSQEELAEALGISSKSISRWEKGLVSPQAHYRLQLSRFFAIAPERFFETNENGPDKTSESLWHVPYPRNPHFTGRDELLDQLDRQFSPQEQDESTTTHRIALTQPQAIKGLGGIGKTQIAVEYAYRAYEQKRFTFIFWINAASAETLQTSFATLANLLPAFASKDEKNQHKLIAAIKRWLEQCQERWLLIYDNADDLSLVQDSLPQQSNGCILLTTRAHAVGSLAMSLDVEAMGLVEGTQLLLHRAQRLEANDEERNEAMNIVIALDGFPLALDQAGAYIEETGCGFGEYLQLYQDHRQTLLARRGRQSWNYPDSVATTWSLSFQKVEQANPASAEFLQFCAFLAPHSIPEELFTAGAMHWPSALQQACADLFGFNQIVENLLRFSLVKRLPEDKMLTIHRLVQVVMRESMQPEEQRQWAERVVCAINTIFPPDPKYDIASWPLCLRYLEQAQSCDTLVRHYMLPLLEAADLFNRTSIYLREHALYSLAEQLALQSIYIREQVLGPNDLLVATSLNSLANLYRELGKQREAEQLFQRALHIQEEQLGPDDPLVATSLYNLATAYYGQKQYAKSEPFFRRSLQIRERQLKPDYHQVANSLHGLASSYAGQERYAEAEPLYLQARQLWEQHLGGNHPHVAFSINNLADLHSMQGHYAEAETLFKQARRIWEQQLGPDHPHLAYPLGGLADIYRAQNRYTEAETLYLRILKIREQALDPQHPDLANTLHEFAVLREQQGRLQEAITLYHRALTIRKHVLGSGHTKTIETSIKYRELLDTVGQGEGANLKIASAEREETPGHS